jgi:hypothetical protein
VSDLQQGLHHGQGQGSEGGAGPHQRHRPSIIDLLTGDHGAGKDSASKLDSSASQPARRGEFLKCSNLSIF